jgi:hypothetical protein
MRGLRNYAPPEGAGEGVGETTTDGGAGSDGGAHSGGPPLLRDRVAFREWQPEDTGEEESGEEEQVIIDAQEIRARVSIGACPARG